jgi:transposase
VPDVTVEQRQAHDRAGLCYPSDLTDTEWALVEPFIPPARRGGRKRRWMCDKSDDFMAVLH